MFTLVQLEYIIAVDTYRHFATAAEKCHVTQPTLSMQLKKLEDDLGIILFDRSRQPVIPTEAGKAVINQARVVINEFRKIGEIVKETQNLIAGELKIGIIPTLAPYLLPRFIGNFLSTYPGITLQIQELVTEDIISGLQRETIDAGILVTPIDSQGIEEKKLFYERFFIYISEKDPLISKAIINPEDLTSTNFWLLASGHCFRNQVLNLCQMLQPEQKKFRYESGSLETLLKLTDTEGGATLIPELTANERKQIKPECIKEFGTVPSCREVSMVYSRNFAKEKLLDILSTSIKESVPQEMRNPGKCAVVRWK
jgi:LysR family transcriptional regulator, hydrogen peroxide-inducible genes activator